MKQYKIFILIAIKNFIAAEILYVLPDNSTNAVSCPSQPCATLSQYVLDNGTLPVVSNVEYHFLPGEHHVPANMTLQNLHNFSIIGTVSKPSPLAVLVLADCSQSYIIKIIDSYNVTIANVILKQCDQPQLTDLLITSCYSCTIKNTIFINLGLIGTNLIGRSHLTEIMVKSNRKFLMFCQKVVLTYIYDNSLLSFTDYRHDLIVNQVNIIGDGSKCYSDGNAGLHIVIVTMEGLTINLTNCLFSNLDHTALTIISRSCDNSKMYIENSTFESNYIHKQSLHGKAYLVLRPLIEVALAPNSNTILFKQCKFTGNRHDNILILILIKNRILCPNNIGHHSSPITNISFVACNFFGNVVSQLININGKLHRSHLLIIGPTKITKTKTTTYIVHNLISINNMAVDIIGPVIISNNLVCNVIHFDKCDVSFYNNITIKSNNCGENVIYLKSSYIKMIEYANITFLNNRYGRGGIITLDYAEYNLNPPCLFQFVTLANLKTTYSSHYSINIINNSIATPHTVVGRNIATEICLYIFYHFTPHCKWIPTAAFHNYSPKVIYQQIIKSSNQNFTYHKICHCPQNEIINCSVDTLGPVYPGQLLQVELCTPCNDKPSTLYAEVNSIHLPTTACKVAPQTETINTISNCSKNITFTIVSEATNECELFVTAASSDAESITEAFYVKLRSCPIGFTLQRGVCDCDPILSSYIDTCYIDLAAIKRPANTWIIDSTEGNDTKYLISSCPMDYCIPYSSNINLLNSDLQCQFSRAGILCSQCQHHLSMIFGSSRCMECTNVHILITLIVIVAGIVLVTSLHLLNLTITNGTINGLILYANVVSINDSIFLVNDNVFKPLRVFISFLNLDLGTDTCFYNGMDSYAKMWLQLFFPFYLIIIAASIIIASRYSYRILRLTYSRSLPVLATLFLLSYTGVLRTVLTVLFSYSTITHLPSGHQQIVWSIDASVPLFGIKFTMLFITCLVLFLLLIPFNIILLFTRSLLQFRIINHFKPLLDAFQGSYKDKYYNWIAINIILRSLFFALYGFQAELRLMITTMTLILLTGYHGYIRPNKNKLVNIQELLLLINLTIMYAVSYQYSDNVFSIVTNVMISLVCIQLFIVVLYHFFTYTFHCNIAMALHNGKQKLMQLCSKKQLQYAANDVMLLNIPERTYNYEEYQDGLVTDDFK